jgi:ABC-type uncharacterized transport system substrate-binding protein
MFISCDVKKKKKKQTQQTIPQEIPKSVTLIQKPPEVEIVQIDTASYSNKHDNPSTKPRHDSPKQYKLIPTKKPNGQRWRIAYLEGGAYISYHLLLKELSENLKQLGWITYKGLPSLAKNDDNRGFWIDFLSSARVQSSYVEFVRDAFYSSNWDEQNRHQGKTALLKRLNKQKDIDLIIAAGTWASKDLATDELSIPVVSTNVVDPVGAGIVASAYDSGLDHFHTKVDLTRYQIQLQLFYNSLKFKTLGVILEKTEDGWTYAAMDDVLKVAKKNGFNVIACKCRFYSEKENDQNNAVAVECMKKLSTQVDAVYITSHLGLAIENVKYYLEPLLKNKIPSFAMNGSKFVEKGILMSVDVNWKARGRFHAETIAKIFNGAKPRDLSQIFEESQKVSINLKTAELIDFIPDENLISKVDRVFAAIAK